MTTDVQKILKDIEEAWNDPDFLESMADSRDRVADHFEGRIQDIRAERKDLPFSKQPLDAPIFMQKHQQVRAIREEARKLRDQAAEIRKNQANQEA